MIAFEQLALNYVFCVPGDNAFQRLLTQPRTRPLLIIWPTLTSSKHVSQEAF